jgi:MFS family permease
MSDAWLARLVVAAIALLLVYQVGAWIYAAFGVAAGVFSAVLVAVVSFFSARMARAGAGNSAWFLVPTLLFTVVPLAAKAWGLLALQSDGWQWMVALAPFVVGFALPVLLLLAVYAGLRQRARANRHASELRQRN